jgi:tRNA A-37 threonylcarbamoyl transferase component Bud32
MTTDSPMIRISRLAAELTFLSCPLRSTAVELIASGRTAEVFAWGDGRVLKLDRPEWNGLAAMEASALAIVTAAGVPAPRPYEMVRVGDRHGLVLERIVGPMLREVIASASDRDALASTWAEMHAALNTRVVPELPDLVSSIGDGIRSSGLVPGVIDELVALLAELDDGRRVLCHFDLQPGNVIVGPDRWVVIDWMTASSGPPDADFARTVLLESRHSKSRLARFGAAVRREGMRRRGLDDRRLNAWLRVIAAARLAEGFDGEHGEYLTALATGARRIGD